VAGSRGKRYAADAGEAGVWLGSRLTNGLLGLLHVTLVTAAIGPSEAGRFFFFWTSVWLLGTVLRFGLEGILPRVVAEAQVAGREVPSLRRPAIAGLAACGLALVPLLVLFRLPVSAATVGVSLALAACWAGTLVLSATLKAHGRVGMSGIVGNTIWPLAPTLAPVLVLGRDAGWQELAGVTAAMAVLSLVAAYAVAARTLGRAPLRRLMSGQSPVLGLEADVVGAALLSVLYELLLWLPVLMLALAGKGGVAAAGMFAAVRVTGLVSWPYNAVVALLTPRIAQALAARDMARTRSLLVTGSLVGVAVTLPVAIIVVLAARPILELFDPAYGFVAGALALLVIGRVFDAAAGPVGEALLVGRGTWLDCALVSAGHDGSPVTMRYGGLMSIVAGSHGSERDDSAYVSPAFALGLEQEYTFSAPARTLSSLLDEIGAPQVDLLSLDVEGFEAQALAGLDLDRHAPRFILVEIHDIATGRVPIEAVLGDRYVAVEQLSPLDLLYARADQPAARAAEKI